MQIRPVRDEDFGAIAALTNRYINGTAVHFGYVPATAQELCASWKAVRARYPFLIAEVAEAGGVPRFAGFAKAYRWRDRDAYAWTAEVGIYIEPDLHGRGLGKALYGALIQACRECGFHTLVAGITLPNEFSLRLHEACGFTPAGSFREVGWKLDTWHSVAFYQLALAPSETPAPALRQPD